MSTPPDPEGRRPLFLARASYRRRRIGDAARILPIIGGILWMVPLLWPVEGIAGVKTSSAMFYLFLVWMALIIGGYFLSRPLQTPASGAENHPPETPDKGST
jgi:hypothetical protein